MDKEQIIAICYDFDGTLIKGSMQKYFVSLLDMKEKKFWSGVKKQAKKHDMDETLSYMQFMLNRAKSKDVECTKEVLKGYGKNLDFFSGVEEWFDLIDEKYDDNEIVKIQHFVISSGIDEVIKGSDIGSRFKHIFASGFSYDANKVPQLIARAVNYTAKTQYLFRINKGINNSWENDKVNKHTPIKKRPIPFQHMIYIGSSKRDVPTMKMLNYLGGYTIAVYPPQKGKEPTGNGEKAKRMANGLFEHERAHFSVEADYSKDKQLHKVVTALIDRISSEVKTSMNLNASSPERIPTPKI